MSRTAVTPPKTTGSLSLPMSVVLARAFGRVMLPVPVRFVPEPVGALRLAYE